MKGKCTTNAQGKPLIELGGGLSNRFGFDLHFVAPLCAEVIELLAAFRGAELSVIAGSPPNVISMDHGRIVLELSDGCSVVRIGANFGVSYQDGTPIRKGLDVGAWKLSPQDVESAGIWLGTWEEAWAFACAVGKRLEVSALRIKYGS